MSCDEPNDFDTEWNGLMAELTSVESDFQKTTLIREFVAHFVDLAVDNDSFDISMQQPNWFDEELNQVYAIFEQDRATAKCGATAEILRRC